MVIIYNLFINCLRIAYSLAAPFNPKARAFVNGRRDFFSGFSQALQNNTSPLIWVHCASLGEFEQGRPLIERIRETYPKVKILLTFFSPSGYEVRKNYPGADFIHYLPWDTAVNASRFINLAQPRLVFFIKYEFWYHYTRVLKQQNIPVISVAAIFRQNQLFFKSYGEFYRQILQHFRRLFVQNEESVALLKSIGIQQVTRAGDTRFDRVHQLVTSGDEIQRARQFKASERLMVIGSCWAEDLDVLIPFINEHRGTMKFILAPHEIDEHTLREIEGSLLASTVRYSKAGDDIDKHDVLLIDNMGMLSRLYRYGEFAYVGGAFGKGLHNILEAACYGIPIFFGNRNYRKFQEAVDLINRGGAFDVADYRDMKAKFELLNVPQNFLLACEVTKHYVEENLGATDSIMNYCKPILAKL
jgi:3-deoxy-D-manno-octulosonic-acid transferase